MPKVSPDFFKYHHSFARLLMGLYLVYFFISLFEQGALINSLFSNSGAAESNLVWLLPAGGLILSLALFAGVFVKWSSLFVAVVFQLCFLSLPIPKEVQSSYITLALCIFALFSDNSHNHFFLKTQLKDTTYWQWGLFAAVYFGFTISGLSKLFYSPWLDGQAMSFFCTQSHIGNLTNTLACAALPKVATGYAVLFIEIFSLPLFLIKKTRALAWLLNTLLHIFIPIYLYVWPVSFGVLLIQILLFDPQWIKRFMRHDLTFLKQDMHSDRQNQNY